MMNKVLIIPLIALLSSCATGSSLESTAIVSVQLQKTESLVDGEWSDVGAPVHWEEPIGGTVFYRAQVTGVKEMEIYTPENTADLKRVILWQYEKAERLKALINYQQDFFSEAVTDFWDSYRNDTFNLDTADSFGLRVWGILLGVDRPTYEKTGQYSDTITVSGTGGSLDGPMGFNGIVDGHTSYQRIGPLALVKWQSGWYAEDFTIGEFWTNTGTGFNPPKTLWSTGSEGSPAPSIAYTLPTSQEPFSDDMYRQLLKSRLMLMRMKATIPNINRYVEFLFPDNNVAVTDGLNMTISYRFLKTLTEDEQAVLSVEGVLPRPAGVKAIQIIAAGETSFGFEGQYRLAADSGTQLSNFDNSTFIEE